MIQAHERRPRLVAHADVVSYEYLLSSVIFVLVLVDLTKLLSEVFVVDLDFSLELVDLIVWFYGLKTVFEPKGDQQEK